MLFYRAHLLSGNTAFIDGLIEALDARRLNALPIFTSSLRALDGDLPAALRLIDGRADVIVSTLSFALGEVNAGGITSPDAHVPVLERLGLPVLQAIPSGMPREAWEMLATRLYRDGDGDQRRHSGVRRPHHHGADLVQAAIGGWRAGDLYAPHAERLDRVAGLAARLARLPSHLPRSAMRVAFVLTNSSSKAAQVGNAVGMDAPASLLNLLRAMRRREGYVARIFPLRVTR